MGRRLAQGRAMSRALDRLAIRAAKALGLDPCVVVAWVGWALSWHPEVRAVRREILRRVVTVTEKAGKREDHVTA